MLFRRTLLAGGLSSGVVFALPAVLRAEAAPADRLVAAARKQVGVTLTYDAAYSRLDYPGGDVQRERGVCTDVLVRAYRDGLGIDLQVLVHEDMRRAFSAYPALWGLKKTDRNIDHRRVPNLQAFFRRAGAALALSENGGDYLPGDIVSQMLPGNLPHIAIVANERSSDGSRPLVVHNIGAGARLEDVLFAYPITGHYRYGV
ncbi:DUF1287 domain-containing protein [Sinorhizobium sp. RAC02]|uniref:DUF1287 domain-containing protein n=1 Tax=Sinorhizobium sp. RAC02 TaxID=1842534 RepID=UPI00083E448D|nr:DUF1287 domain-containing protein [Sinorhizobium sp. RAC02]